MLRQTWHGGDERGDAARALVWLLLGVAVLVLIVMLVTPELVWGAGEDGRQVLGELTMVIGVAGVPGVMILFATTRYRRRRDRQE